MTTPQHFCPLGRKSAASYILVILPVVPNYFGRLRPWPRQVANEIQRLIEFRQGRLVRTARAYSRGGRVVIRFDGPWGQGAATMNAERWFECALKALGAPT